MMNLKNKIELLGLNYKKEVVIFILGVLVISAFFPAIYFYSNNPLFLLIPSIVLILFIFLFLGRYDMYLKAINQHKEEEFIHLFTYFGIFIGNGFNVYNSLQKIKEFASDELEQNIGQLILDIDNDKSVTPYIKFSKNFKSLQIKEVMLSIYQMVDEGEGGPYIVQYSHLFGKLSDEKYANKRVKRIEKLRNMSIFPLIGSAVTLLGLTLLISNLTGGTLNGL